MSYGQKHNLEFVMTSSDCVMLGRFFTFSYDAVDSYQQHTVAIEEYYPCIPGTQLKRGNDKYVCVAGQSLRADAPEWIEYVPPSRKVSMAPDGALMDSYLRGMAAPVSLDFTVLPSLHTPEPLTP